MYMYLIIDLYVSTLTIAMNVNGGSEMCMTTPSPLLPFLYLLRFGESKRKKKKYYAHLCKCVSKSQFSFTSNRYFLIHLFFFFP